MRVRYRCRDPSPERNVPFTVWCDDRLVGESDLDYLANTSEHKMGDFAATEYGEQLIPILMAPRKAVCAHKPMEVIERLYTRREEIRLELRAPDGTTIPTNHIEITDLEWLVSLVPPDSEDDWQADLELAEAELALELEPPEDEEGERLDVMPPEWLEDDDEPLFDEFDVPDLEQQDADAPPPDFPRYQIQVELTYGG